MRLGQLLFRVAGARCQVCGIYGLAWLEGPHLLDVHFAPGQLHQQPFRGAQVGQHFGRRVGNKEHHRALRRCFHIARVDSRLGRSPLVWHA
jgi:hypothetical protein